MQWKTEAGAAVAHLALARSQKAGAGTLGIYIYQLQKGRMVRDCGMHSASQTYLWHTLIPASLHFIYAMKGKNDGSFS